MRLAALSYGYGVTPETISGTVAGIFPSACVIATDDENLVTLVTEATGNLPGGIVLDTRAGFDFSAINTGVAVSVRTGLMRFASSDLVVDIRPAKPWRSDLSTLKLNLAREDSRRAWGGAAEILKSDGRAVPFMDIARAPIDELADAVLHFDLDAAKIAMLRLIGLGEGTTPAGDDFLVGLLGGLWACVGSDSSCREFAARFGEVVAASVDRTHRASRTYLVAAGVGEVSERLTSLIAALASVSITASDRRARAAIAVGHSSGACGVLGLLVGTSVWSAPDLSRALIEKTVTPEPIPPVPA